MVFRGGFFFLRKVSGLFYVMVEGRGRRVVPDRAVSGRIHRVRRVRRRNFPANFAVVQFAKIAEKYFIDLFQKKLHTKYFSQPVIFQ